MFNVTAWGLLGQLFALGVCGLIAMVIAVFNRYVAGFFFAGMLLVAVLADIAH